MFIDQTKQVENYTAASSLDKGRTSPADKAQEGNGVLDYGKMQETYRMTEGGSFYMPNAVYQKPEGKEEESVVEQLDTQMDMSAANRKNQMVVVSNTASSADLEEMSKDGFDCMDADSHTIITVTDKIKAVLAKAGVDISIYGDELSSAELEAIAGNPAVAAQMERALKQADLPTTEANITESVKAYQAAEEMLPLSDATKEYLLKNGWEPTIQNIYMAAHSGVASQGNQQIDFSALEKQMEQIIKSSGLTISEESKANCQWLIQKNIGLTVSNLRYLDGLNHLSNRLSNEEGKTLDMQQVIARIMEAIRDGRRPMDALLMEGFSYEDRAQSAMNTILEAQDCDIAYCVEQQLTISVENLQSAISNRGEQAEVSVSVEMSTSITFVTAKRQLEETRLAMTTEANYALLKRGISIDTKPLEQVVENLKNLENQYYKDLLTQNNVEASEENVSIFSTTTKYVEELKFQPAYVLDIHSSDDTLRNIHQAGSALKTKMDTALQTYEVLWTAPRRDMGDSIQKAFANVDDILTDLNLEKSEWNQRAVRILAYNETEITVENIHQIKEADMEVQKLFRNLTPATTLELIREGKNPLDMEISQLNQMVETMQAETGEKEQERFSKFLWKLEQNKEISAEERDSYIGIYRLIAQVEKTDGAAIGALMNQGADITMRNILTAMRSAKKDMDYTIDDDFAGAKATAKGPRIDAQIMASFQTNCVKEAAELLSPEALEQMQEWEEMTPEQLLENLQKQMQSEESVTLEQQYHSEIAQEYAGVLEASDDVYAFLEKYDMKNSARNVLAASRLLHNPSNVFDKLFETEGKSLDYQEMIVDLKAQVLEDFGEAVKTPEEMVKAQATLAEVAERVMQTMIIENETISAKDLNDLRLMSQQFYLCKQKAEEESFLVPVETGDTVTGVNLKIVRGKSDKGLVDIFFRGALMEKVAASFEAKENGISGVIATTDEETRQYLAQNLNQFVGRMQEGSEEAIDVTITRVENLSAWQFEKNTLSEQGEATPVQTKRLYHIAESFIQTISDLM
ncbi:MAG: hypothetical protein IJ455_04560 [Agathobacter sp.]|nr:hypothetical protein [Agathobacter sp.]